MASVPAINSASVVLNAIVRWILVDQEIGDPSKRKTYPQVERTAGYQEEDRQKQKNLQDVYYDEDDKFVSVPVEAGIDCGYCEKKKSGV